MVLLRYWTKLGFGLAEMQEEFFLLSQKPFRKIKVPKVLSWDLTGHPEQNVVRIGTEERRFELLDDAQKRKMIRIAPHPRDPHKVFKEQINMIRELKDQGYTIPLYRDLSAEIGRRSLYDYLIVNGNRSSACFYEKINQRCCVAVQL